MGQTPADVADERHERVARAVREWTAQLIDLTGRNQLLFYKTLKRGTLELSSASPGGLAALLSDGEVRLSNLLGATDEDPTRFEDARKRAAAVHSKALEHFEERGIDTLFLAHGMASWTPTKSQSTPAAPVLLRPLRLKPRGASAPDYDVSLDGDWDVNATLLHLLATEFQTEIDSEPLLALLDTAEGAFDPQALFDRLVEQAGEVPDFHIVRRIVAGTFAYTKLPMVKDLQANVEALAEHDLIAAVAGVAEARESVKELRARDLDASLPDYTPPADEFLILEADASQNLAVNAALAGEPLIIQGPPGTGKSQTIANLITTLAARGKRVLFVAEKRAAIEAVTKRLGAAGLGDLVMDLHGGVSSKKQMATELGETLARIGQTSPVNVSDLHHTLETSRAALSEHVNALHARREPWGMSLFEVHERLLGIPRHIRSELRFTGSTLQGLDEDTVRTVRDGLAEWAGLTRPMREGKSAWTDARVTNEQDAQRALELVDEVTHQHGPQTRAQLDQVLNETGLPAPNSIEAWHQTLALLNDVAANLELADIALFDLDLTSLETALTPATRSGWHRMNAQLFNSAYRDAKRSLREVWRADTKPGGEQLHDLVSRARDQLERWKALGGQAQPRIPAALDEATSSHHDLNNQLAALGAFLVTRDLTQRPHTEVVTDTEAMFQDQRQLFRLPRIHTLESYLDGRGLGALLASVQDGSLPSDDLVATFEHAWLSSLRQQITTREPRLREFDGELQTQHAQQFRAADQNHLETTAARVRRAVAEAATATRNQHPDQDDVVAAQARRKRGHLALRRLFEQAPDVLTALRPCWAMSPLVVSQTLPAKPVFDVVIFDEASQVLPADAIPALLRAPQAIVAGDRRQLPPTTFFAGSNAEEEADEDDDGSALTSGFESVLDVLDTLLGNRLLSWHYRSRDERLIAFSNHRIYDSSLTTFPGAFSDDALRHVLIPHQPGVPVDTRSSDAEVATVIDLMIGHARTHPDETVGVIAMGQHHAGRIEAALRQRIAQEADPALNAYFDESAEERAFVKNLERVQGDERDAIILSIGYGKDVNGNLPYRFGPIMQDGGERRLNVAVTRARRRLTLVSSFAHTDMAEGRSSARGVELLRNYLKYVASGGVDLDGAEQNTPLNPFEIDVKHRLEAAGMTVIPQYGTSGFRIDFAVPHPTIPGKMLLAVEADGASYHSSHTARDRDRLRQEVLENLGWRFHRIWSTDWFNDAADQVQRALAAYERALDASDSTIDDEAVALVPPPTRQPEPSPVEVSRGPKPWVAYGLPIGEHQHQDLVALATWIGSDSRLRTNQELMSEMMVELGFQKRGKRIVAAIQRAIDDT